MPASYAHQFFGDLVLRETAYASLIQKYQKYYNLGLQGPDLLFYFHPTHKNPIIQKGSQMHEESALTFFEKEVPENDEKKVAYLLGFICHFTLDAACHPYINQWVKEKNWGHYAIERELDQALIRLHPEREMRVAQSFADDEEVTRKIGQVLGVEEVIIRECITSFKTLNGLIYSPSVLLRDTGIAVIRVFHLGSFGDMFLREKADEKMKDHIDFLIDRLKESVAVAAMLQDNFMKVSEHSATFDELFKRNYL